LKNENKKEEIIGFLSALNAPEINVSWDKVITQKFKDIMGLRSNIVHDGADFVLIAKFPFAVNNVECDFRFNDGAIPLISDEKKEPQVSASTGNFTPVPYESIVSNLQNNKVFMIKIYDINYLKSHMRLCLAWKNEVSGQSYLAQCCYDIYDDNSVKQIGGVS